MQTSFSSGAVPILVCFAAACRSSAAPSPAPATAATAEPWSDGTCDAHACQTFTPRKLGEAPPVVKDAAIEFTDFGQNCRIAASWRVGDGPGVYFQATVAARMGGVFPLPDGLVSLHYCQDVMQGPEGRWTPPLAGLVLDPDPTSLPPLSPGDVFIPFRGDARLDADLYTEALVEGPSDPSKGPAVTVIFHTPWFDHRSPPGTKGVFRGLRAGDGFAWGRLKASVVRVVLPSPGVDGWVEVAVSSASRAAPSTPLPP